MIEIFEIPKQIAEKTEQLFLSKDIISWSFNPHLDNEKERIFFSQKYKFNYNTICDRPILSKYYFTARIVENGMLTKKQYNIEKICSEIKPLQDYVAMQIIKHPAQLVRMMFNMFVNSSDAKNIAPPHTDYEDDNYLSFLYYVNDSDGETSIFDNNGIVTKTISPKKGYGVLFKSSTLHAGSFPTNETEPRVVISFGFKYL